MNVTRRVLLGAPALALPGLALAQAPRGPNGGPIATEHGHTYELVISGAAAQVILTEGSRPMATQGASGRLVVQSGGRTVNVPLTPASPNRLAGSAPAPLEAGARIVFTGQLADGHRLQGRFVIP
ncbi:hypothetical protein EJV46_22030 [Roseococcus sp. SYP-B2431]|uniref:hypothetical protein n=1 Tax=Roseococcus sp. SYP-B2431 TaxID=2496640 RepID=UPI001038857A|nr:hypothetical protein [Roseococcus sp. SYP-B2431]TCH95960.1 hypothetical protein EJV46_22030 [Roseococcus sp. SYP-B2431]